MAVRTRWYIEAIDSEAEKVLNEYPEFQKNVLTEDLLHNVEDTKGKRISEVYRCDYDFVVQFRVYVNANSKKEGDNRQLIDLFRVFVRYGKEPLKDATSLFKVRRWRKKPLPVEKKK